MYTTPCFKRRSIILSVYIIATIIRHMKRKKPREKGEREIKKVLIARRKFIEKLNGKRKQEI